MAEPTKQVQQARAAYSGRRWEEAHRLLTTADQITPLQPEDLERLAVVAALLGRDDRSTEVLARLYHLHLGRSDVASAARDASWLALTLIDRGEMARGAGWLGRARTLLADGTPACAADGFVLLPEAYQNLVGGDVAQARDGFDRAAAVGARFNDPDLVTLAGLGGGMARILSGERAEGVSMLDEVMVAVTSDEVSPIIVGIAYCAAIETWRELCDLHRAREWTAALSDWCASQPDLVPYRGQCQVHRSEVLQLRGAWGEAMEEVLQARRRLSAPPGQPAAGMACYQQAELHRLRGQFAEAEEAYRDAGQWGRDVQPGLALLRLAQGRTEEAGAALHRVLAEAPPAASRAEVLAALVDTSLAAGATAAARSASDELAVLAAAFDTPLLDAISALAGGAVDLAEGDPGAALVSLRQAARGWQALEAPYEDARTRVLIGLACRLLGDESTAGMELDSARRVFQRLGATPDVARVGRLAPPGGRAAGHGLTGREAQVLRLVAAGRSNKAIAAELYLSVRTVDRHLSNIFAKLGVPTRTAAAMYAREHHLI